MPLASVWLKGRRGVISSDKTRTGITCSFSLCSTCLFLLILKNSTSLCLLPFFMPTLSPDASWAVLLDFLSGIVRRDEVRREVRPDACCGPGLLIQAHLFGWVSNRADIPATHQLGSGRSLSRIRLSNRSLPMRHALRIDCRAVNGAAEARRREHLLHLLHLLRGLNAFHICKRDHWAFVNARPLLDEIVVAFEHWPSQAFPES
jgi:hypothetical protein